MKFILTWIRDNKLKFFIVDFVVLIINLSILNFVRNGSFINLDHVINFFVTGGFFCLAYLMIIVWTQATEKLHFFFIKMDSVERVLAYIGMIIFLIMNVVLVPIVWLDRSSLDDGIVVYFAIPWLLIISTIFWEKHTWKKP